MRKISNNFLIRLLLIILIVNSLLINANRLNGDNPKVKNIIVGSASGGWSHVRQLLVISKILVDRGYNVTFISPGNMTEDKRIKHYSTGPVFDVRNIDGFDEIIYGNSSPINMMSKLIELSSTNYLKDYRIYEKVTNEVKPALFLCALVSEVCHDIAWKSKKPAVSLASELFVHGVAPFKSDPIFGCHVNMENKSFLERFRCFTTPITKVFWATRSVMSKVNEMRAKVGVSPTNYPLERTKNSLFLANTFFGFDIPVPLPPIHQDIGPIMSEDYPPLAPETKKFLDSHPRTMFASFGSMYAPSKKNNGILLRSFIEAIEKGVIDGAIWGLSKTRVDDIPKIITLSNGKEFNTMDIINNKHPNIQVLSFAPQFSILEHENCKVFFSHGGTNSAHEALYNGKPLLVMPIAFNHYGNAEQLEEFSGVSLTLDKANLNVDEILTKTQRLISDEKFKINGEKVKFLARIDSKRKYRAVDLIEYTIKSHESKEKLNIHHHQSSNDSSSNGNEIETTYLNEWISPAVRMGFVKGNYYDVFLTLLAVVLISLAISIFTIYKLTSLIFAKFVKSKLKNE